MALRCSAWVSNDSALNKNRQIKRSYWLRVECRQTMMYGVRMFGIFEFEGPERPQRNNVYQAFYSAG